MVIQENKFVRKLPSIKNFESIEIPSISVNNFGQSLNTETFRKDFKELVFTCTGSFFSNANDDSEEAEGYIYIYDGTNSIRLFYSRAYAYDSSTSLPTAKSSMSYGYSIKIINNFDNTYNISINGNSSYGYITGNGSTTVSARHDILSNMIFNNSESSESQGTGNSYSSSINSSIDLSTFAEDIQLRIVHTNSNEFPRPRQKITGIYIIR